MREETVYFRGGSYDCRMALNYPQALALPMKNLKKLFELMRFDPALNADALRITAEYLSEYVAWCKQEWASASTAFQLGYVDTKFNRLPPKQKRATEAENKRLYREVVKQKKAYEQSVEIQKAFEEGQKIIYRRRNNYVSE